MKNIFIKLLLLTVSFYSFHSMSAQPSAAQIAQFKKMPPAQQKALAKQFGVDIGSISGGASSVSNKQQVVSAPINPNDSSSSVNYKESEFAKESEFSEIVSQKKLKPFGYDIFTNAMNSNVNTSDIAIPEGYILGVGDQISIQMFGKRSDLFQLDVSREGEVIIPELGPFQVVGLSFREMKNYLISEIKERIIGANAVISLSQLRTIRVFVLGDAYKPGPYQLSSLSSITHALFTAGGVSNIGSLRNIQLKRSGKLITSFDFYDLLINGDTSKDLILKSGDVVFIQPKGKTVSIAGQVKRPAIYEIKGQETVKNVIALSSGLLPAAYKKSATIERFDNSLRSIVNVDLTNSNDLAQPIKDGDYINVMEKSDMYADSVTLIGAVTRPGKYQWKEGIKVSDLIQNIDTSILKYADLTYSIIVREINIARDIEVHQFSLAKALSDKNSNDNFVLQARDKILIFSSVEKLSEEIISLDKLAFTQKDLLLKEKQLAKEKYNDRQFWQKFGHGNNQYSEVESQTDVHTEGLFNQSVNAISAGQADDVISKNEISTFSRQRLLGSINQKLISQGASGQPIQLVEIDGQVKFPGTYPLTVNAKITDLVTSAGGVTESAYLSRIDITRNSVESLEAQKQNIQIDLSEALNGNNASNLVLQSKDRLHIHQIPAWTKNHTIELKGEFVFPGRYSIQRGDTLSDIIKRAGGFTDYAYMEGSVFSRVSLQELEKDNIQKLANDLRTDLASKTLTDTNSNVSYAETQQLLSDLVKLEPIGRLVINLQKVISKNDYNVLLESGDILYVPAWKNSVNVIGQVQVTSSHIFEPGLTAYDYISRSGNTKKRADNERIYVIAANGSINVLNNDNNWFSDNQNKIMRPGDTVVVPLDSDYTDNLTLWTTATTILYNTAVAFAAINGI